MKRILIVEDEDVIRDFEVINLKRSGYEVVDVANGEEALAIFERNPDYFDVALLDVMMPGFVGVLPPAKSQEMDKVNGLMIGADDYVTKPFSPSELVARVDAIHRRVAMAAEKKQAPSATELQSGPFTLNIKSRTITKNGQQLDLTQVEYQMLEYFFHNPNTALGRQDILNQVCLPNSWLLYGGMDISGCRLKVLPFSKKGESGWLSRKLQSVGFSIICASSW